MQYNHTIDLDMMRRQSVEIVTHQYDDAGRAVRIRVLADGEPATLPANADIRYSVSKPDGTFCTGACSTVTEDNKTYVVFTLTYQMLVLPGREIIDISIRADGASISTMTFINHIQRAAVQDGDVESSSEFDELQVALQRMDEIRELKEDAEQAVVDAQAVVAGIQSERDQIATNTTNIATNTRSIGTNANNIATNATNIATNAAGISDLDDEVAQLKEDLDGIIEPLKNLFDKNNINTINGYIDSGLIKSNANARTIYILCDPNTTYTVSKTSATKRFVVAYTTVEPTVGGSVSGVLAYNNNTSITITTGENARYLVAWVYLSTADTLTFDQICAMLQIEKGSTATAYEAYALTAVDDYARDDLESLHTYPVIQSDNTTVTYGDELITDFSALTAIGSAAFADGKWTIPSGSGVSQTLSVTAWKTYVIDIGLVASTITDGSSMYKVNSLTVTLGNATTNIFANTDGTWKVGLTPSASGTVTFSMICNDALELVISSLSIKQVTKFADIAVMINQNPVIISQFGTTKNIAVGNGQKTNATGDSNVAIGYNAQAYMATGNRNTAVGAYAQNKTKTGTANVAIGDNTQTEMESGMFNVAIGTATQRMLTYGSWNVGVGNEVQRNGTTACNNVGIGRRAQSYITTGGMNTAIGAMSGFSCPGHQAGDWATKTSNYQTLVGGESTQATTGTADYLTTLGFRAKGNEKAIAIGANASATGEKSIAIGYGAEATNDNEVVIGLSGDSLIICGKRIVFNSDHSVTWENVT